MRNTKQRNLILSIVEDSTSHLDAYQIYDLCKKVIPNISLGTVYRNLGNLVDSGLIVRLKVFDTYRYDKNTRHSHFICNKCHKIIDIFDDNYANIKYIGDNLVTDYEIKYKGICRECMERNDY
ncbi:MAG: Fur family transcriptional regulator [Bacilli bacterium]